jgi:excisionase family DNA binding protein
MPNYNSSNMSFSSGETPEIKPNKVYTTHEAKDFLKISGSTIKRLLKKGIIQANKVGGRYRIWGREILRLLSPEVEIRTVNFYQRLKEKTKKTIEKW